MCFYIYIYISRSIHIHCFNNIEKNKKHKIVLKISFVEYVDQWTIGKVLDGWTLFSNSVLSYRNITVFMRWTADVCMCVFPWVCICRSIYEWLMWRVVLPIKSFQCYRSGKAGFTVDENRESGCLYSSDLMCLLSSLVLKTTVPF